MFSLILSSLYMTGCIVLIDEVTLRLIHSRCASLANQSAVSVTEIRGVRGSSKVDLVGAQPGRIVYEVDAV